MASCVGTYFRILNRCLTSVGLLLVRSNIYNSFDHLVDKMRQKVQLLNIVEADL